MKTRLKILPVFPGFLPALVRKVQRGSKFLLCCSSCCSSSSSSSSSSWRVINQNTAIFANFVQFYPAFVIAQNIALLSNFTMHSAAVHGSLARQPCPAVFPGRLARQPCPAV
jgi:hypothetical protein